LPLQAIFFGAELIPTGAGESHSSFAAGLWLIILCHRVTE
jgi:hypothetical protein